MKTEICVVSGFFESGKTSFIKSVLSSGFIKDGGRTIVLQCEQSAEQYDGQAFGPEKNIFVEIIRKKSEVSGALFSSLIEKYSPDRMFIEYNGTWEIGDLLKVRLPSRCRIRRIIHIANGQVFGMQLRNMTPILAEPISNSDFIVLNRAAGLKVGDFADMKHTVRSIRRNVEIMTINHLGMEEIEELLGKSRFTFKHFLGALLVGILFLIAYLFFSFSGYPVFDELLLRLRQVNTIFAGMLMQAIPFLLIGVFVSSILQVLLPQEKLAQILLKNKWLGFPLAACMGIALPLCDCAMAPMVFGMTRKGVPLPYAVAFLLAAPIMNPIVIFSTLYAFPGQPQIALYRILLGIAVALSVGALFFVIPHKKLIRGSGPVFQGCAEDNVEAANEDAKSRAKAVFRHAGFEFLNVGRFVVLGAFIAAILQIAIPKALFADAQGIGTASFAVIACISLFMSICATSNAFIARSFSNFFSLGGILSFMVLGPMVDIKNLILLSGAMGRRFVILLVLLVLAASFAGFCILSVTV